MCRVVDVEMVNRLGGGSTIRPRVVACAPLDPDASLEEALERLQTERLGALPVVSSGAIVGLLRVEDVAHLAARTAPAKTGPPT